MRKQQEKVCLRCKQPAGEGIVFAFNPRTGGANATCEKCLNKTRVHQKRINERVQQDKLEELQRIQNPTDGCPWPATLSPVLVVEK